MSNHTISNFNIKAVILVAARDFGRCPLASRLNRACWPMLGQPVLQRLIDQLAKQGIRRITVCCESQAFQIKSYLHLPEDLDVQFHEDTFPRGPAGSIRDVICPQQDEHVLVLPGCIVILPDVEVLTNIHIGSGAEMTVFGISGSDQAFPNNQSQVYMCRGSIFEHIPEKGYFDIKEGLVPALVKAGKVIYGAETPTPVIGYKNWREYLFASKLLLSNGLFGKSEPVETGNNVQISPTTRVVGPVVIGDNSIISDNVILFGPTIIGNRVHIGSDSIVEESVLWDDSSIGAQCRIRNCLIDDGKTVPDDTLLSNRLQPAPQSSLQKIRNTLHCQVVSARTEKRFAEVGSGPVTLYRFFQKSEFGFLKPFLLIAALLLLIFVYWNPTLIDLWNIWMQSDEYSCGLLVPFAAAYVLWMRRDILLKQPVCPSMWGLGLLIGIQVFRYWSMYYMFDSGERLSFVLSIGALVFAIFGMQILIKFFSIFLFLFLMLPLPNRVENLIVDPLQIWATVSSVFCLETLGYSAVRQGNIININGTLVAVAEACNGLRMLTAFIIVSFLAMLLIHKKRWEKGVILASCIPIALLCNTIRLTLTSIAFTMLDAQRWEKLFHDFGGFAMIPLALGFILFELWLLSRLVIEPKKNEEHVIIRRQ